MDKGQLVPDEVVIGMISSALDANKGVNGFLFDGFPRTTAQAEALDKLLQLKKTSISLVIALQVPETELISRLVHRAKTSGRSDDADETIQRKRLDVYLRDTLPVAAHYREKNKVIELQGVGSIEDIFNQLVSAIDKKMQDLESDEDE